MLQTILQQITASGADVFAAVSLVGVAAWSWILAQPLWLTAGVAGGLTVLIGIVMLIRVLRTRPSSTTRPSRRTSVAPKRRAEMLTAESSKRMTPAQSARILAARGLSEVEISKQTGLARDAVSMLVPADGTMPTRQGRPSPAGVAVPRSGRPARQEVTSGV